MIYPMINDSSAIALEGGESSGKRTKNNRYPQKVIICISNELTSICKKLYSYGYEVVIVKNCQGAVQQLFRLYCQEGVLPDIFIGDATKMEQGGRDLVETLYRFNEFRSIPLLLFTFGKKEEELFGLKDALGADDIVSDSITAEQLHEKILVLRKFRELKQRFMPSPIPAFIGKPIYGVDFFLKRVLDIIISFSALAILSPLMLLIMVVIRLESKGPVFYISFRAGNGYKIFRFLKFRTMIVNADKKLSEIAHLNQYDANGEKSPVFIKVNNDPRITKIGSFLRKTSLDELPQLINVLKGEMSLVGNRPLPLYEAVTLTTDEWAERFLAPAGITGLWQISKRGKEKMSVNERISLDIDYARKNSFLYDIGIMLHTPSALIQKENV